MKKIIMLLTIVSLLVVCVGCGNNGVTKKNKKVNKTTTAKKEDSVMVDDYGFTCIPDGDEYIISYCYALRNNTGKTATAVTFTLTGYDENDKVIDSTEESIDMIPDGQIRHIGIMDDSSVKYSKIEISNIEANYLSNDSVDIKHEDAKYEFSKPTIDANSYLTRLSGTVKCNYEESELLDYTAIFYKDGKMIGGDSGLLNVDKGDGEYILYINSKFKYDDIKIQL